MSAGMEPDNPEPEMENDSEWKVCEMYSLSTSCQKTPELLT
jgi:hypothetical protein